MKGTITLAGAIAQKPRRGGHTWVFLQYLLGFRKLGWDVLFLDQLDEGACIDSSGQPCTAEESLNVKYFLDVMRTAGLHDSFSLQSSEGNVYLGLSRNEVLDRIRRSTLFFNVTGFLKDEEILETAPRRVFLDIDPGFIHMWQDLGLADLLQGYDDYVSIAGNIGTSECSIPTCGLNWIVCRQPVVLERWQPHMNGHCRDFTTIATWRGAYGPLEYRGKAYRLRAHEFRKFASLPRLTGKTFRIAIDIHAADATDLELLRSNGWSLVDPLTVAGDPQSYQQYIHNSGAEIMIAKNMYVESNSGWFSDRSICYLASGKPVLAQDTGIEKHYPTREGIVAFRTIDEAVAGVEDISEHFDKHSRTARQIAEDYFDSDKVLSELLCRLNVA
jgi:hypothetical protein